MFNLSMIMQSCPHIETRTAIDAPQRRSCRWSRERTHVLGTLPDFYQSPSKLFIRSRRDLSRLKKPTASR